MSEAENTAAPEDGEEWVTMHVARGFVLGPGKTLKPGDTFEAPVKNMQDGIYPVRYWLHYKKAGRTPEEAKKFAIEKYDGRKGGPVAPEPPAPPKK